MVQKTFETNEHGNDKELIYRLKLFEWKWVQERKKKLKQKRRLREN